MLITQYLENNDYLFQIKKVVKQVFFQANTVLSSREQNDAKVNPVADIQIIQNILIIQPELVFWMQRPWQKRNNLQNNLIKVRNWFAILNKEKNITNCHAGTLEQRSLNALSSMLFKLEDQNSVRNAEKKHDFNCAYQQKPVNDNQKISFFLCISIQDVEQLLIRILKPIMNKLEKLDKMERMMDCINATLKKELEILTRDNSDLTYLKEQFDKVKSETFKIVKQQSNQNLSPTQSRNYQYAPSPLQQQQAPIPQFIILAPLPQTNIQQTLFSIYEDQVVYRSENGQVYHQENCEHYNQYMRSLSLSKAQRIGLRPCKNCHNG